MRTAEICLAFVAALASCALPIAAAEKSVSETADALFRSGKFAEAAEHYDGIVADDPDDYAATLQLGRIALLSNRLDDAENWFKKATSLKPNESDPKIMLAEAYYRRDEFDAAAASLKSVDVGASSLVTEQYPTLNVAKLESFKGQTPYQIEGEGQSTRVQLLATDPLPLVRVRVNGRDEVTFFIDTGGSEVVLDSEFAKELAIPSFGAVQGTFSGGQTTEVQQGRIESLAIGDWTIRNLPVATLPLRQLSEGLGARIDGLIGTTFFYHFLTTLDLPHGELVLRRKSEANLDQFIASAAKSGAIPIWMASDHFMVGWGRVASLPPTLLFVDTGLAGAGVKLAESVIKQAGITLDEDKATAGAGAGGTLETVPYTVPVLTFGDVQQQRVAGLYDGPFPWENLFGFHLAGMVGHDFFERYAMTFDFENMRIYLQ